ncbi:hypothetical protein WMO13_03730 [Ignatzschineria larvae DSM 13226]|uniref:Uncharacterized protein n=1 Tax=Ignatzschineria larvae DSM 13226 TaxID=1111732 RepID=A0ABZ3C351_9GAMM|nr:hypothetical protein [Ignatzschineria larvae]
MYYQEKKRKSPLKWLILLIVIAFIVWVILDDTDKENETNQIIEVQLPR